MAAETPMAAAETQQQQQQPRTPAAGSGRRGDPEEAAHRGDGLIAQHPTQDLDLAAIRREIAVNKGNARQPEPEPEPEPEEPRYNDGGDLPQKKQRSPGGDKDKATAKWGDSEDGANGADRSSPEAAASDVDDAIGAGMMYVLSPQFEGYKEGYVFKEGTLGKGYYKDSITPAEKMSRTAEVLVEAVEVERAKRIELEEQLAKMAGKEREKKQAAKLGFTPNTSGRGPAHIPHFLWPTVQHSTSFGKATYTKTPSRHSRQHVPREQTRTQVGFPLFFCDFQ